MNISPTKILTKFFLALSLVCLIACSEEDPCVTKLLADPNFHANNPTNLSDKDYAKGACEFTRKKVGY
jgi:hypothetical protein